MYLSYNIVKYVYIKIYRKNNNFYSFGHREATCIIKGPPIIQELESFHLYFHYLPASCATSYAVYTRVKGQLLPLSIVVDDILCLFDCTIPS